MADTCATCLFYVDNGCHCDAPRWVPGLTGTGLTDAFWPPVASTDWCGKGIDSSDYHPFTPYPPAP